MNILDVVLIGNNCDILIKKGDEVIKYTLSLSNPKLCEYIDKYLIGENKLLNKARDKMEDDYRGLKYRNMFITYGIGGLLALILFIATLYANVFIGVLGFFGSLGIIGVSKILCDSFEYDKDPKKEEVVNNILLKIDNATDIKTLCINKINLESEKRHFEEEKRKLEKEQKRRHDLEEEAKRLYEIRKAKKLISSNLYPHQKAFFDEVVEIACTLEEFKEKRSDSVRQAVYQEFLRLKGQDVNRDNLDIIKDIRESYINKRNKKVR